MLAVLPFQVPDDARVPERLPVPTGQQDVDLAVTLRGRW
jgi:hypothetical protein